MTATGFLRRVDDTLGTSLDRAIALLWWAGRDDPTIGLSSNEICDHIHAIGHPTQNASRLNSALARDSRTSKGTSGAWRLRPKVRQAFDSEYSFARTPPPPPESDSVLPRDMFVNARRGYISRVVDQINKSYDAQLFDCTAVMCRRLGETLIIEVYEHLGRQGEIKDGQGHYLMLNGLITFLTNDASLTLGRSANAGLDEFKRLGDLSAHNRRYNAHRDDIDRARNSIRVAIQELLNLAGLS